MSSAKGKIPAAPYPPMADTRIRPSTTRTNSTSSSSAAAAAAAQERSRSRSFSSNINMNNNKSKLHAGVNSPPPSRNSGTRKQLPASIQFYTSDICGAVNCKEHIAANVRFADNNNISSADQSTLHANNANNANAKANVSNAASQSPVVSFRDRGVGSSQDKAGVSKLGPVLLELRYLQQPTPYYSVDGHAHAHAHGHGHTHEHAYSHPQNMQIQTFAISRGIPSLGTGISSTCLSFRKHYDIHGTAINAYHLGDTDTIQAATGLTTGALCLHTLRNVRDYLPPSLSLSLSCEDDDDDDWKQWRMLDSANSVDASVSYFSHYQPRHHRQASSVAWRPGAANSRFVAIGLLGSSGAERGGGGGLGHGHGGPLPGGDTYSRSAALHRAGTDYSKDRDYCALVWDIEASASSKGVKQVPLMKLAHNTGVASLAWMSDGQLLAVGCTQRNIQIYDLRIQGTSSPPISAAAHDNAVHGIAVDPSSDRSFLFASFSRGLAEPVKLWDMRRMESCVAEIKMYHHSSDKYAGTGIASHDLPSVSAVAWDTSESQSGSGVLSIASSDSMRFYDTRINPSRPSLTRMTNSQNAIQSIAFQPPRTKDRSDSEGVSSSMQRMLVVEVDGSVRDLPFHQVAPVAISSRDGRISNSVGSVVWVGATTEGPAAMESTTYDIHEDVSKVMMRRARCLHEARYSTDVSSNLQMISMELQSIRQQTNNIEDVNLDTTIYSREQLWRLWSWIERVEDLCSRNEKDAMVDERRLPAKGLQDAGVLGLLKMDTVDSDERSMKSPLFNRNIYDSPMRRDTLTACGWVGKFGIQEVLSQIESLGGFERSAALAVWNSDIGEAVSALQRGAELMRMDAGDNEDNTVNSRNLRYAETLELVAMCIAGYSFNKPDSPAGSVWKRACESLLKRPDLIIDKSTHSKRGAYLRAICTFLISAADEEDLKNTLDDKHLSLSDRCAFATIFLSRKDLKDFLQAKVTLCIESGNLEGILITGMDKKGIALLQSYIDTFSDVQTAALVSSRVVLPPEWTRERMVCSEWLEAYREMLNKWQMWQSRALFDVGRAELLRKLRERQQAEEKGGMSMPNVFAPGKSLRRQNLVFQHTKKQSSGTARHQPDPLQPFPPQLHARCNYCNTSLPLSKLIRRQDGIKLHGIANDWLSRQNPVLSCCPNAQCRKPLPRCAICLLPLGCLNPYLELRKHGLQNVDDLSELSSLPFAEWFTWCMRCKHGGHSHHMVGWFSDHDSCPVSNCDCRCQFDGIQKLKRIGFAKRRGAD